jgi:aldose 1-epimerase
VIERGAERGVITEVGATLRSYSTGGVELLDTFSAEAMSDSCRGQVLAPWPNRIDHGRYRFSGRERRLALSEPERDSAIHGLVRWLPFSVVHASADAVRLACLLYPQEGYEFMLGLEVGYSLGPKGLEVELDATNLGTEPAPFGAGYHPYLASGSAVLDDCSLRIPAATVLTTNDRLIPTGRAEVAGTELDFTSTRRIGAARLDLCFTDLKRDDDGLARVLLEPPGRPAVSVSMDERHSFLQVYTGDTLEDRGRRRRGLAVEPMTCAPDAFNSGAGLIVLEPGESFAGRWGLGAA